VTPGPDLQQLINTIKTDAGSDDELTQLATAAVTISDLTSTGDAALGFFVDRARGAGKSWVEISAVLGVSKQAAHKRFADSWTARPAFERFTQRARSVVRAAADIARERNHNFVGTEHLLLGMFAQPEGIAAKVLVKHGITEDVVRQAVDIKSPAAEPTTEPKDSAAEPTAESKSSSAEPNSPSAEPAAEPKTASADPDSPPAVAAAESKRASAEPIAEPKTAGAEDAPYTRRAAHVLQGAVSEALTLGHNYVGTEHLLLAFYRDSAGIATKILLEQGLDEAAAWTDIRALLEDFTK
jgi:ATP-dependent Clp protease ATP-binding subunit ClpA